MKSKILTLGTIIFSSVILTSTTIEATSRFEETKSWLGSVFDSNEVCPVGMVKIIGLSVCIDLYEVSASDACPHKNPASSEETAHNLVSKRCEAQSIPGRLPWSYVTWHQANQICAEQGRRLPTNIEWYRAALGTKDTSDCIVDNSVVALTGSKSGCVSGSGVYDMIGNVWEYTADEVIDGTLLGVLLPESGYVAEVSTEGVPTKTTNEPVDLFNKDYFWRNTESKTAVLRGGFYGSGEDGGLYSLQTMSASTFSTAGVGFRCVFDLNQ